MSSPEQDPEHLGLLHSSILTNLQYNTMRMVQNKWHNQKSLFKSDPETLRKREKGGNQESLFMSDPETLLKERVDAPEHTSKLKLDLGLDCKILSQRFNTFIWKIRDSSTVGSEEVYPGLKPCTDKFFPFHV